MCLYPIPEIMNFEIERGMYGFYDDSAKKEKEFLKKLGEAKSESEKETIRKEAIQELKKEFGEIYKTTFNACIDLRYRKNDFHIYYAVFNGSPVSEVIELQPSDMVIEVGLDFKTHTTKQPNGEYPYPNPDYILEKVGAVDILRVCGFHMGDCVEKLARKAYDEGLDVLVDEDLTEFFPGRLRDPEFRVDKYPNFNPRKDGRYFERFMAARKDKPWLWQKY